jgi:monoamine oxidase
MAHSRLFQKFRRTLQKAHQLNHSTNQESFKIQTSGNWKRRRFLRLAALASGSAVATTTFPLLKTAWSRSHPKIAIVGGGLAGLNAAYQLKKAGLTATVYEGRGRVGGRIHSVTGKVGKGLVIELGGSFININHEDLLTLVKEFDLKLFNRVEDFANSSFPAEGYYFDGKLHSEAEVAEKLRPLAAQIAIDSTLIDEDFEQYAPDLELLSVTEYLDRHADKISEPFIRKLIESTIRTEYGVEPEESSALQLLYNLPTVEEEKVEVLGASDETYMVEGGNSKIIEALAAKLTGQIQTKKRLLAIKSRENSYELLFKDKSVVNADYVIIAIPFSILRQIDIQVELPPTLTKFIQEVDLGSNEKVFAGFNHRIWRQEKGFAGALWSDLGFSEVWDATRRQRERDDGALTFFFGGEEVNQMRSLRSRANLSRSTSLKARSQPLKPLGQDLLNRFEQIIPEAKSAATNQFFRTSWADDPFLRGSYTNWKPGQYLKFSQFLWIESKNPEESQDVCVDNLVFAGEHLSDEFYGFMNGAAQTGRLAAEVVARKVYEPNLRNLKINFQADLRERT